MYSAGSKVPWRVRRVTRHTLHLLKTLRGVFAMRRRTALFVVLASREEQTNKISSEATGLSTRGDAMRKSKKTNEHGRGAGIRSSPGRTAR